MSEFSDVLKVIIEKGGFKTFIASILGAILFYKLILDDCLWAIVVLCSCYLVFSFLNYIKDLIESKIELNKKEAKRDEELKHDRIARYNRLCILYNSLPKIMQQSLIELYKLPQQAYSNVRILNDFPRQSGLLNMCYEVSRKHYVIGVEESIMSSIITIEDVFCDVLAEHVSDFE